MFIGKLIDFMRILLDKINEKRYLRGEYDFNRSISKLIHGWSSGLQGGPLRPGPHGLVWEDACSGLAAFDSHPLGRLERDGSDRRRVEHLGALWSRSARRADTASPRLHPSRCLVHPAAAWSWPGHSSPAYPQARAPRV